MDSLTTARLTELAECKLHLLRQLRELSIDQNQLVASHRVDELVGLLSRKGELIDRLRTVQEQLKPFQAQEPEKRSWPSEADRVRCRSLFANSEKLLAELLAIDNLALGEMTLQRDLVGHQLNRYTSAEAILEAYGGQHDPSEVSNEPTLLLDG